MGPLTDLLNPRIAVLYAALLPQFMDPQAGPAWAQLVQLGSVRMVVGISVNALIMLGAARMSGFLAARPRVMTAQRYVAGGLLGVFALRTPCPYPCLSLSHPCTGFCETGGPLGQSRHRLGSRYWVRPERGPSSAFVRRQTWSDPTDEPSVTAFSPSARGHGMSTVVGLPPEGLRRPAAFVAHRLTAQLPPPPPFRAPAAPPPPR
ncbi:LysE family translocator [Streptomyces flaveolus]|uniref:LysE family translocator n=1 Tax=Streptomyces flaveolus TaxID=67297 RepID=UPI0033171580